MNELLTPYIPSDYSLKSPKEFIDALNVNSPKGIMASLDVESLFTNVPVDETIQMILNEVYRSEKKALDIPEEMLKKLLICCTKEAPFRAPNGNLYKQTDGVAMGSPLGVLFANFYMGCLERRILTSCNDPPYIYTRYIDDIFVDVRDNNHLEQLKEEFQNSSCLKFTTEININNSLPFLDILVTALAKKFHTTVYTKKTNMGLCLNAASECPDRYTNSVINSYINRAFSHCSTWTAFHEELMRVSQILVNNGYKNKDIQSAIKRKLEFYVLQKEKNIDKREVIKLYYKNQMTSQYKIDERVIKEIISRGIKPTSNNERIDFNIYYKNRKTSNLILINNTFKSKRELDRIGVVYQYQCPLGDCKPQLSSYIGQTTTTLSRRLTMHLQSGAIKNHTLTSHQQHLTREMLVKNTKILDREENNRKLTYLELIYINFLKPSLNIQGSTHATILPSLRDSSAMQENNN